MMNFSRHIIPAMAAAVLLFSTGCSDSEADAHHDYTVTFTMADSTRHDSLATLHIVDDTYGRLMPGITEHFTDGTATFTGQTHCAQVAFVTFDSITPPFYFVLEPGNININIKPGRWSITGGRGNAEYVRFLNQRQRIVDARKKGFDDYRRAALDTTLTLRAERRAAERDSLLADSLQRMLLQRMQGSDPVSRIVRQRLIGTLTPATLQRLGDAPLSSSVPMPH